jgi:hypothetical protein
MAFIRGYAFEHCNSSLPITIISIAQMEEYSILALWNDISTLQNLHSTLPNLCYGIKYHGFLMSHLPSIEEKKRTIELRYVIIRLDSTFRATNWNLTLITHIIWRSQTSNTHKNFTFPSQSIW